MLIRYNLKNLISFFMKIFRKEDEKLAAEDKKRQSEAIKKQQVS